MSDWPSTNQQTAGLLSEQTIRRLDKAAVLALWTCDAVLFAHALAVTKRLWEITEKGLTQQRRADLVEALNALSAYTQSLGEIPLPTTLN